MSECRAPWLVRLLYTHNPFYLISACLFVYGLKRLFRVGDSAVLFQQGSVEYMQPAGLMGSLFAVTILMAVTAVLIVRLGKVWEDARSLVLIVLLMLLAISVSLDELLVLASEWPDSLTRILLMIVSGITASVLITEMLVRGLQVRFTWHWRLPLYLLLGLFFLWPALLLPEVFPVSTRQIRILIATFPTIAGIVSLTLVPGIRRGSQSLQNNGTPWTWPWIPWTPFVFLALAVCFRAYSLTISFDAPKLGTSFWDTVFGVYQLVPFAAAILFLVIEVGRTEGNGRLASGGLLCSPVLLFAANPWAVPWSRMPSYQQFTGDVVQTIGSPVYLTLWLLTGLAAWSWRRGVRFGENMTYALLLAAVLIGPNAVRWPGFGMISDRLQIWPLAIAAGLKLVQGVRRDQIGETLAGLLLLAILPLLLPLPPSVDALRGFLSLHLALAGLLAAVFIHHRTGRTWGILCSSLLSLTMAIGCSVLWMHRESSQTIGGYAFVMTFVAVMCYRLTKIRWFLVSVSLHCVAGLVACVAGGTWTLATSRMESGMRPLIFGAISFAAAVAISVLKTGAGRRLRVRYVLWRQNAMSWLSG